MIPELDIRDGVELHDDLVPYLCNTSAFQMLRHPLVYSVPYHPQLNAIINKQYKQKKNAVEEAKRDKKFSSYIFLHERPYRINAFSDMSKLMNDKEYYETLSHIWIDSENIYQNKDLWKSLMKEKDRVRAKRHFMSKEDQKYFDSLPDIITVYRGYDPGKNKVGFSYSLSEEKAEWFAKRFNKNGMVVKRKISKLKIFAYTNSRNEQEIIIV